MSNYLVISDRLDGFPAGTVIAETDLADGVNVPALVTAGHIRPYDEGTDD